MPAPLTITADDKSRDAGQPNPPLTASYAGFVAGETAAVLGGTLSLDDRRRRGLAGRALLDRAGRPELAELRDPLRQRHADRAAGAASLRRRRRRVDAALAPRDARLLDRSPARDGGAGGDCKPPAEDERLCVGWPVCQVARPVCEARPSLTLGR